MRKDELLKIFEGVDNKELIIPLINEAIELEAQIDDFRLTLKKIVISPSTIKKYKFYHSCYKDYLTQYTQVIKTLMSFLGKDDENESSPLRDFYKQMQERMNNEN